MRALPALAALALAAAPCAAQSAADHVAMGDSAHTALRPEEALAHYQAAIALDSTSYEALWKAARSVADIAKQVEGDASPVKQRRDSLYSMGRDWAEAAVRANPEGADGHYALSMVLGRLSRTRGGKERVRFAKIIFDEATRALELDPDHDLAHHVLGAWHAEVKRLSGIQKFFARTLFGGGFLGQGKWEAAVEHLERAVALKPDHVYHRLELGEVYIDVGLYAKAREHLTTIATLPIADVLDQHYKDTAAQLLEDIKGEKDQPQI